MFSATREFIYVGSSPAEAQCAQLGITEDFRRWNRLECNYYISALVRKYGPKPDGAHLLLKAERHDAGTYYEVICQFNTDDEMAMKFAYDCEAGIETWEEVAMKPPVIYGPRCETAWLNHSITSDDKRIWGLI